jgi:ribosome-associated protein
MIRYDSSLPLRHAPRPSEVEDPQEYSGPSRTQRKNDDRALQALGEELVAISTDKLAEMDLPDRLKDAVIQARGISKFGALRRQMQYIGRLMREDADADTIRARLDSWKGVSVEETARLHLIERWRLKLLEDEKSLDALITEYPQADIQRLRTLMRNAKRESDAGKPPKSFRELFQVLRELFNSNSRSVDAKDAEEKP